MTHRTVYHTALEPWTDKDLASCLRAGMFAGEEDIQGRICEALWHSDPRAQTQTLPAFLGLQDDEFAWWKEGASLVTVLDLPTPGPVEVVDDPEVPGHRRWVVFLWRGYEQSVVCAGKQHRFRDLSGRMWAPVIAAPQNAPWALLEPSIRRVWFWAQRNPKVLQGVEDLRYHGIWMDPVHFRRGEANPRVTSPLVVLQWGR